MSFDIPHQLGKASAAARLMRNPQGKMRCQDHKGPTMTSDPPREHADNQGDGSDNGGPPHDSVYYLQLARAARIKAAATNNIDLSIRLREAAVLHERKARRLKRTEDTANEH